MIEVIVTFKDSLMKMWEFVLPRDENLYRVSCIGDCAIVTAGSNELFNAGTPNLRKTLLAYLRRRFRDFQIMDFSEENIEAVCEDINISLQSLSFSFPFVSCIWRHLFDNNASEEKRTSL